MIGLMLPPPYHVIRLALERPASTDTWVAAKAGEEQGVIFWTERSDRLDFALTLKPDRPGCRAAPASMNRQTSGGRVSVVSESDVAVVMPVLSGQASNP